MVPVCSVRNHVCFLGTVFPALDVALLGPDGRPVPLGQPGEVAIRGPTVMWGYVHHGKEAGVVDAAGWFHTGDVAVALLDGGIRVVDRIKDMVLVGGENVYCSEVEHVLVAHPAVAEAAVVGIPNTVMGEVVGAAVVLSTGSNVSMGSLTAWCAARLASFKVPARFVMLEALPKTG